MTRHHLCKVAKELDGTKSVDSWVILTEHYEKNKYWELIVNQEYFVEINYCPFCGEELQEQTK